jgi:hypothetical protein
MPMADMYFNDTKFKPIHVATFLNKMISSAYALNADIGREEARVGISDPSDPGYSALARSKREQRDNISATITSLELLLQRSKKLD